MTKQKGVINPAARDSEDMFIGWAKAPAVDRRFLLGALPLGLVGAGGASWLIASELSDPGAGAWLTDATHNVTGILTHKPYPMIRTPDPSAPFGMRTVLIVAQGKCTSALKLADLKGQTVMVSGALIERKTWQMLEVPPFLENWLAVLDEKLVNEEMLTEPPVEQLGGARLSGTIMDSKCFFGVMRPGRGKTHKACASLCIRGGIPPSFWVRTKDGRENVLLMTNAEGGPVSMDILPLVADPVEAEGDLVRVGDLLQFRADVSAFRRI